MSDIAILKKMIKEDATVSLEEGNYRKKAIELTEESENYSVTINGMPNEDGDEVIIIKADQFVAPTAVFEGSKGECKRADFIIIADIASKNKKFIICIELKGGKGENDEIIQQLKGAWCFAIYCQSIGQNFWNKPQFLKGYEYRFVSITHLKSSGKPSSSQPTDIHNCPENRLNFSYYKYIEFNRLIGVKKRS